MGRTIDQDVHAAFVEFKAKGIVIMSPSVSDCIVYSVTVTVIVTRVLLTVMLLHHVQKTTNACPFNASTANRFEQRTPRDRRNIC